MHYTVETMTDSSGAQYEQPREISRHASRKTAEKAQRKHAEGRGCWVKRSLDGATLAPDGEWIGTDGEWIGTRKDS